MLTRRPEKVASGPHAFQVEHAARQVVNPSLGDLLVRVGLIVVQVDVVQVELLRNVPIPLNAGIRRARHICAEHLREALLALQQVVTIDAVLHAIVGTCWVVGRHVKRKSSAHVHL